MPDFEFSNTNIPGLLSIQPKFFPDERGYLMKSFEKDVFLNQGLPITFNEFLESRSAKGTLRGIHIQTEYPQGKLVRVSRGVAFEVAVDLRSDSSTFGKWQGFYLSETNKKMLYLPEGFGASFLALEENTVLNYLCTDRYSSKYETGIMWNDKDLKIDWPLHKVESLIISEKDKKQLSFLEYCRKFAGEKSLT